MSVKRILIPTDFSETADLAIAHGAYMAHLFKAKIFLLHAVSLPVYAYLPDEPMLIESEIPKENEIEQKLNHLADAIVKKYNIELSTLAVNDKPAKAITKAATDNNVDIIIMGTHGVSGFDEFFAGSNTQKVVSLAPCPTISVQKSAMKVGFFNILLPIDNDLHSRQKVNNVIELAEAYKSTVHILGLLKSDEDAGDEHKLELKLDTVKEKLTQARIPFSKKIIRGNNLATEAMNYSGQVNADLVVVLTGHESNLNGAFLGTFTEQIVNHSKIPVMSIKPEETTIETFDPTGGTGVII